MARRKQVRNFSRDVARAPYNFVPLPERIVDVREQYPKGTRLEEALPDHNRYLPDHLSGYFDVTLTTESLTYIRAPQTESEAEAGEQSPKFFYTRDDGTPVIPGSSMRGMLRSIFEIITFSKIQPVSNKQLVYRAVGDQSSLGSSYRNEFLDEIADQEFNYPGSWIRGGYLCKTETGWAIQPAKEPGGFGESFVHVWYDESEPIIGGSGRQQVHDVFVRPVGRSIHRSVKRGRDGRERVIRLRAAITDKVSASSSPQLVSAKLIESGNMGGKHWHCAIFEPDSTKSPISIPDDMWRTYCEDRDLTRGIPTRKLAEPGDPLFYSIDPKGNLAFFGPTMMFRLPYINTIWDLIPEELTNPDIYDFAEAVFGFVRHNSDQKQGKKERSYAGRVAVGDATLLDKTSPSDLFAGTVEPRIMSTPKPTTFQHYLVQEQDDQRSLAHYDDAERTELRGHKLYWRQRTTRLEAIRITQQESRVSDAIKSQSITPVQAKVDFAFRVYFDNLTPVELGGLAWALALPSGNPEQPSPYRHMIGMGKAFGMGVVKLNPTLYLVDRVSTANRASRYQRLFEYHEDIPVTWYKAERRSDWKEYSAKFEKYMLERLPQEERQKAHGFHEIERINTLLLLLEGRETEFDLTHMMIERPDLPRSQQNEFKRRNVLPDPKYVIGRLRKRQT